MCACDTASEDAASFCLFSSFFLFSAALCHNSGHVHHLTAFLKQIACKAAITGGPKPPCYGYEGVSRSHRPPGAQSPQVGRICCKTHTPHIAYRSESCQTYYFPGKHSRLMGQFAPYLRRPSNKHKIKRGNKELMIIIYSVQGITSPIIPELIVL